MNLFRPERRWGRGGAFGVTSSNLGPAGGCSQAVAGWALVGWAQAVPLMLAGWLAGWLDCCHLPACFACCGLGPAALLHHPAEQW